MGVQSSATTGSRIMPLGNAVGKRKFKRCEKKERSRFEKKMKESLLQASQSSNQDAELDVAKCPGGGQER